MRSLRESVIIIFLHMLIAFNGGPYYDTVLVYCVVCNPTNF